MGPQKTLVLHKSQVVKSLNSNQLKIVYQIILSVPNTIFAGVRSPQLATQSTHGICLNMEPTGSHST